MANPFYGGQAPQQQSIPGLPEVDKSLPMDQAFQKFASEFQGNPQQMVANLMMNGIMSQNQFQKIGGLARMFGLIK